GTVALLRLTEVVGGIIELVCLQGHDSEHRLFRQSLRQNSLLRRDEIGGASPAAEKSAGNRLVVVQTHAGFHQFESRLASVIEYAQPQVKLLTPGWVDQREPITQPAAGLVGAVERQITPRGDR